MNMDNLPSVNVVLHFSLTLPHCLQAVLADLERSDLTGDALDGVCGRMQGLIGKLGLPGQLLDQVGGRLGGEIA